MNLTEKDAKAKWCPFARAQHPNAPTGGNRVIGPRGAEIMLCIGSACMAWQWDELMHDGPDSYISEPGPTGHCGLTSQEVKR